MFSLLTQTEYDACSKERIDVYQDSNRGRKKQPVQMGHARFSQLIASLLPRLNLSEKLYESRLRTRCLKEGEGRQFEDVHSLGRLYLQTPTARASSVELMLDSL